MQYIDFVISFCYVYAVAKDLSSPLSTNTQFIDRKLKIFHFVPTIKNLGQIFILR